MSRKPSRKKIIEQVSVDIIHEIETDIGSAISYLQELQRVFIKAGYSDLYLEEETTGFLIVAGVREETDDEYKERCMAIKKRKASLDKRKEKRRTKEYKEYLKLKEKFDNV